MSDSAVSPSGRPARSVVRSLRAAALRPVPARPLALFRIAFGIVLLIETVQNFVFRDLLFAEAAPGSGARAAIEALHVTWIVVLLFLIAGVGTRVVTLANYALVVGFLGFWMPARGLDWHVDGLFVTGSILLAILPVDRDLAWRGGRPTPGGNPPPAVPAFYLAPFAIAIGGIYLDSILWKLSSPMYRAGLGAWAPASLPFATFLDLSWLLERQALVRSAGYFVLAFELAFLVLLSIPRLRPVTLAAGLGFHLGCMLLFPIPTFSLLMAAFYLGLLPSGRPEKVSASPLVARQRTVLAFLAFWCVSLLVLGGGAPLWRLLAPGDASARIARAAKAYRDAIYPWTGFTTHGVFMDGHFERYDRQRALIALWPARAEWLPWSDPVGRAGSWSWNREWVVWTFRAAAPYLSSERQQRGMERFARAWLRRKGHSHTTFAVVERDVRVRLRRWEAGLASRNLAAEWRPVACFVPGVEGRAARWQPSGPGSPGAASECATLTRAALDFAGAVEVGPIAAGTPGGGPIR